MALYLRDDLRTAWGKADPFETVCRLQGQIFRELDGRKTLRFEALGKGFFLKLHAGVGWVEILKNLLQFKWPVLGAENEWKAIQRLSSLGVDTMTLAGYGSLGVNPARRKSFVITDEITGMRSLEETCSEWSRNPPPYSLKRNLVFRVASITRVLHTHGMNHRDYYICHFLSNADFLGRDLSSLRVVLIDLHRVQFRRRVPKRWLIKDLAALYYSAMDIGLHRSDLLRFVKIYSGKPLRAALGEAPAFWKEVIRKARGLYVKVHGQDPPAVF